VSYIIQIGALSFQPGDANAIVDWQLWESIRGPGELTITLERRPSGWGIVQGDIVTVSEGGVQTWMGAVRKLANDPEGNLVITCLDRLAHLSGSGIDELFMSQFTAIKEPLFFELLGTFPYPYAAIPHSDWQKPLRDVKLMFYEFYKTGPAREWIERDPPWPGAPVTWVSVVKLPPVSGGLFTGTALAINFRGWDAWVTGLSIPMYINRLKSDGSHDPTALSCYILVERVDNPSGAVLPLPSALSSPTVFVNPALNVPSTLTWDWKYFLGIFQHLDPNQLYRFTLKVNELDPFGNIQYYDVRMPMESYFENKERTIHKFDQTGTWLSTPQVTGYVRANLIQEMEELTEGLDFSIQSSGGVDYIVFDKWRQPDILSYPFVEASYIRGSVQLNNVLRSLWYAAGMEPRGSVPLSITIPALDATGSTVRDILDILMDQYDVFSYLSQSDWKAYYGLLPDLSSSPVLYVDQGESGISTRNLIIGHSMVQSSDVIYTQIISRCQTLKKYPQVIRSQSSFVSDLDVNPDAPSFGFTPGFYSTGQVEKTGWASLDDMRILANLELAKQQPVWTGELSLDGVWPTVLRPGSIIHVRIDSIGLNEPLRVEDVTRGRWTTKVRLSRDVANLVKTMRMMDRRLNQSERTSIPEDFDRQRTIMAKTKLASPQTAFINGGNALVMANGWARIEDLSGLPVTPWVLPTDTLDVGFPADTRRHTSWFFPPNMEHRRMPKMGQVLRVARYPESVPGSMVFDFTVPLAPDFIYKWAKLGIVIGLEAIQ